MTNLPAASENKAVYRELRQAWEQLTSEGAPFEIVEAEVMGRPLRIYKGAPPSLREIWLSTTAYGERDTQDTSQYRDDGALRENLSYDSRPGCPQRGANGQLPLARRAAG